jgi:hypothetical protein
MITKKASIQMKRKRKTSSELIIDALRTGQKLKLSEITQLMSQYAGTDIKIQNVSSTMAKLSDNEKTEIGYFISRQKTKQGYVYKLAEEALTLTPEQTYGLIRKVGKNRFTIKDAIEAVPSLKKYMKGHGTKKARRASSRKNEEQAADLQAEAQVQISDVPEPGKPGKPSVTFSVGNQPGPDAPSIDYLTQILKHFTNGNLNVTLNINIRFLGLE